MTNKRPVPSKIRVRAGDGPPPSVDGHPGWVADENAAWGWTALLTVFAFGLVMGTGMVLSRARSAAWWVNTLGALAGALLTWLPVWGVMRAGGERALTCDEALCKAFGAPAGAFLSLAAAVALQLNAAYLLTVLSSFIRLYMIEQASDARAALVALGALALMLCRRRARGFSRGLQALRFVMGGMLAVSALLMLLNASALNLVPVLGKSAGETLAAAPFALGSGAGAAMLGVLPRLTGSAKPPRFGVGCRAAVGGALLAGAFTLLANLSVAPQGVENAAAGGIRMMLAIEYLPKAQFFRVLYQFVLMLVLLAGAGASLAGCGMLLVGVWRTKKQGKAMLCACLLCVPVIFCPDDKLYPVFERGHALRALALALPAWVAWPILEIRGRKRRAQR